MKRVPCPKIGTARKARNTKGEYHKNFRRLKYGNIIHCFNVFSKIILVLPGLETVSESLKPLVLPSRTQGSYLLLKKRAEKLP